MTRYYLYAVLNLIIIVATFGFTAPALISSADTGAAIAGAMLVILLPLLLYWLNRSVIKEIIEKYKSPTEVTEEVTTKRSRKSGVDK